MKKLISLTIIVFICLQFTCGHSKRGQSECAQMAVCKPDPLNVAQSALNRSQADFWHVSCRIDSLMQQNQSGGQYRKPVEAMRATDPVHY